MGIGKQAKGFFKTAFGIYQKGIAQKNPLTGSHKQKFKGLKKLVYLITCVVGYYYTCVKIQCIFLSLNKVFQKKLLVLLYLFTFLTAFFQIYLLKTICSLTILLYLNKTTAGGKLPKSVEPLPFTAPLPCDRLFAGFLRAATYFKRLFYLPLHLQTFCCNNRTIEELKHVQNRLSILAAW